MSASIFDILADGYTDLVNVLQDPQVRKRVEVLRELHSHHVELEEKFFEELAALEAKYQKLYQPLYTKRYDIVNGIVKVEQTATETTKIEQEDENIDEKGVPNFWLTALKNNDVIAEEISERDEGALKFLKDIKWSIVENPRGNGVRRFLQDIKRFRMKNPKAFKLEFFFDTNPYFKNAVLTKTYHVHNEDKHFVEKAKTYDIQNEDKPFGEKAIGTEIDWHVGKCLTQKILKMRPKIGSNAKPITKTEQCESFFNFFSPPQFPKDEGDTYEDAVEEFKNLMEQDYEIGSTFRDKIIPHAVLWFTDEAADDEYEDMIDDGEDEDEEDEDDDEDDDEEEEKPPKKKSGSVPITDGQQGERPPECKQQ